MAEYSQHIESISSDSGLPESTDVPTIPFSSLEVGQVIGEGNYGDVFRSVYLGTDVAVKQILLDEPAYAKYIEREIRILATLRHPFILQFLGVSTHEGDIYIVTEFLSAGDLNELMARSMPTGLSATAGLRIMTQLAQAMVYLHSKSIVHRDLKPDNILLDARNNIRLADFGLARVLRVDRGTERGRSLTVCGTDGFIAPEVMLGMAYTRHCDVFGFGMCLAQLMTHREPGEDFWNRNLSSDLGLEPSEFLPIVRAGWPSEASDLTIGCVAFDFEERPEFTEVLVILKYLQKVLIEESAEKVDRTDKEREADRIANEAIAEQSKSKNSVLDAPTLISTMSSRRKASVSSGTGTIRKLSSPASKVGSAGASRSGSAGAGALAGADDDSEDEDVLAPGALSNATAAQMLLFHVVKLIRRSTSEDYADVEYAEDFLLVFPEFLPPKRLLKLLIRRFRGDYEDPEVDGEPEEAAKKRKVIQLRTVVFVKMWVHRYPEDFADARMRALLGGLDTHIEEAGIMKGSPLLSYLERGEASAATGQALSPRYVPGGGAGSVISRSSSKPPTPLYSSPNPPTSWTDVPSLELARQLTILAAAELTKVRHRDLLTVESRASSTSTVAAFLAWTRCISQWIVQLVVSPDTAAERAAAYQLAAAVAAGAVELRSWAVVCAVTEGLAHSAVARLQGSLSRDAVAETGAMVAKANSYVERDFAALRATEWQPPCVPSLQLLVDEIVYVESSSQPRLPNGIINFRRFRQIGRVVRRLERYQQSAYNLESVEPLQVALRAALRKAESFSQDDARRLSLLIEPPRS